MRRRRGLVLDLVPVDEAGRVGPVVVPFDAQDGQGRVVPGYGVPSAEQPMPAAGLISYATPRVRQHAGDAAVIAYALAVVAVCVAVVLVAAVFGVAAYRVVAWMWPS